MLWEGGCYREVQYILKCTLGNRKVAAEGRWLLDSIYSEMHFEHIQVDVMGSRLL